MIVFIDLNAEIYEKLSPESDTYDETTKDVFAHLPIVGNILVESSDGQRYLVYCDYRKTIKKDPDGNIIPEETDIESQLIKNVYASPYGVFSLDTAQFLVEENIISDITELLNMDIVNNLLASGDLQSVEDAFDLYKVIVLSNTSPVKTVEDVLNMELVYSLLENGALSKIDNCFLANTRNSLISNGHIKDHKDLFNEDFVNMLLEMGLIENFEDVYSKAKVVSLINLNKISQPLDVINVEFAMSLKTGTLEGYTVSHNTEYLDWLKANGYINDYFTESDSEEKLINTGWKEPNTAESQELSKTDPHRYYLVVPHTTFDVIDPNSENFNPAISENLKRFSKVEGVSLDNIIRKNENKAIVEVVYDGYQYLSEWLNNNPDKTADDFNPREEEYNRLQPYIASGLIEKVLDSDPDAAFFEYYADYLSSSEEWKFEEV
jgi:hypothetical protein